VSTTADTAAPSKIEKVYRFISKGLHFQIVHVPPQSHYEGEQRVIDNKGHIIDFGTPFRVEGADQPKGVFVTTDEAIAEWLRAQDSFNVEFWEPGNEPDAVHPTMAELAPMIAKATAELDTDTLRGLLEEELATHSRADVVSVLEASIHQLEAPPA
jgi:hypothetical protein